MNALKKVEKLFKSFQKNPNAVSNLRPVTCKAHTMTTRPLLLKNNYRLETEFHKQPLNLKALSKFIRFENNQN
jgi:hypothetical protein